MKSLDHLESDKSTDGAGTSGSGGYSPLFGEHRVLVVEDNKRNRLLIEAIFQAAGIRDMVFAENGREGLEKVDLFQPDLVVLDIIMPEMDGFEFLKRLRADTRHRDLPVLVETGLTAPEERRKIFASGATDLVSKPIDAAELIARVGIQLENRALIRSLRAYRSRIEHELETARSMQEALLPTPAVLQEMEQRYGLDIATHFEPSSELGGDFWHLLPIDDRHLGILSVDFSGHGVTAALNTFRLHTLIQNIEPRADDPAAFVAELNAALVHLIPRGQFATMLYGVLDTEKDELRYSAAGAPEFLMGKPGDPGPTAFEANGIPLGITKSAKYKNRVVPFPKGSYLFAFSDALFESEDRDGVMLEEAGVADLVTKYAHAEPPAEGLALTPILDAFFERVPRPVPDDLTALWLAR